MKKKTIIYLAIISTIILIILIFLYKTKHGSYTLEEVNSETYSLEMPLNFPLGAVQFWKSLNIFDISEIYGQVPEWQTNMKEWRVYANKSSDIWHITVITRRNFPSFSCGYSFTTEGQPISDDYITKPCSWNK